MVIHGLEAISVPCKAISICLLKLGVPKVLELSILLVSGGTRVCHLKFVSHSLSLLANAYVHPVRFKVISDDGKVVFNAVPQAE